MSIDKKLNELEKISKPIVRKAYTVKVNEELLKELKIYLKNYNISATDFFESIVDIKDLKNRNKKYEHTTISN
ncbi:hypothetical protein [Poseidonibacter sp.]|uniref:hypothetical protein n=1 Tax=Poseidonibacter sp. TaxID=2321188 RepID=UPI003C77D220